MATVESTKANASKPQNTIAPVMINMLVSRPTAGTNQFKTKPRPTATATVTDNRTANSSVTAKGTISFDIVRLRSEGRRVATRGGINSVVVAPFEQGTILVAA